MSDDAHEVVIHLGHVLLELRNRQRVADAGDHVLALCVDEVIAVEFVRAVDGVAGEGDARAAVVAHVAKDNHLDVDGRAQVMRDVGGVAVVDGALAEPGIEDGAGGHLELLVGILGELHALVGLDERLEALDHMPPILFGDFNVVRERPERPSRRK